MHCHHSPADRLDILDLYGRYAHTIDSGDFDAWSACFQESGRLHIPARRVDARGPGELQAFGMAFRAQTGGRQRHLFVNIQLTRDGADMRGRCNLVMVIGGSDRPAPTLASTGWYDDLVVRDAGGWLFAERVLHIDSPTW